MRFNKEYLKVPHNYGVFAEDLKLLELLIRKIGEKNKVGRGSSYSRGISYLSKKIGCKKAAIKHIVKPNSADRRMILHDLRDYRFYKKISVKFYTKILKALINEIQNLGENELTKKIERLLESEMGRYSFALSRSERWGLDKMQHFIRPANIANRCDDCLEKVNNLQMELENL